MASRCSLAKTHRIEIRKALAVIRRSKTSRKQVCVKWVVGRDSNFSGLVFGLLLFLANLLMNMQITLDSCENGGPPPLPFSGGEERSLLQSQNRRLRREACSSPPVFSRGSMDITFFGKICGKRMNSKGEKNYRKWCQNDQEGLKH